MRGIKSFGEDSDNNKWKAVKGEDGKWTWIKYENFSDKEVQQSSRSFSTEDECKDDAKNHGFDGVWFASLGVGPDINDR